MLHCRRPLAPWALRRRIPDANPTSLAGPMLSFSRRRFLQFGTERPAILCVVPWLDIGGAEQVVLQLIRGLSGQFSFVVVATLPADHNRAAEFREATPWVYHLPETADPGRFLAELAAIHGIRGVLVSSSEAGYRALPALKRSGLWTADIVHNTAPEGHLDQSIGGDGHLDFHFACGRTQADALRQAAGVAGRACVRCGLRSTPPAASTRGAIRPTAMKPAARLCAPSSASTAATWYSPMSGGFRRRKTCPCSSPQRRRSSGATRSSAIRALIAGDGPELLRVEQAIEREGVWNEVRLLGDSRRVAEILAVSDYLLLTSKTEGSPLTVLEAMSLERIVLSTAVGNVREVIDDGVNGFVIEGRDPATFAARFDEIQATRAPPSHAAKPRAARSSTASRNRACWRRMRKCSGPRSRRATAALPYNGSNDLPRL